MAAGGEMTEYLSASNTVLTAQNYNETDAYIFAELSYMKFEKLPNYTSEDCSLKELCQKMLDNHLISGSESEVRDKTALLEAIAKSDRYSNCTVNNLRAENVDSRWAAMTINIDKDNAVISMRGTDGTTLSWTEDLELAYDIDGTQAQRLSTEYLGKSQAKNIFLTGHSKGGNNVISAYVSNDKSVRDKVVRIDNYDGPGVNPEYLLINGGGYLELNKKLNSYYPENSIVGMLLVDKLGKTRFYKTDTKGHTSGYGVLDEHDPFAAKFENGRLVPGEQSFLSRYLNNLVDLSVSQLPLPQRYLFVKTLVNTGVPAMIANEGQFDLSYYSSGYFEFNYQSIMKIAEVTNFFAVTNVFLMNLIPALAKTTVETGAAFVKKLYLDLAEKVKHLGENIKAKIVSVGEWIAEKAEDAWNGVKEFVSGIVRGRTPVTYFSESVFSVQGGSLNALADKLSAIARSVAAERDAINSAQHSLVVGTSISKYFALEKYEHNVLRHAENLRKLSECLKTAVNEYKNTENQVAAFR